LDLIFVIYLLTYLPIYLQKMVCDSAQPLDLTIASVMWLENRRQISRAMALLKNIGDRSSWNDESVSCLVKIFVAFLPCRAFYRLLLCHTMHGPLDSLAHI